MWYQRRCNVVYWLYHISNLPQSCHSVVCLLEKIRFCDTQSFGETEMNHCRKNIASQSFSLIPFRIEASLMFNNIMQKPARYLEIPKIGRPFFNPSYTWNSSRLFIFAPHISLHFIPIAVAIFCHLRGYGATFFKFFLQRFFFVLTATLRTWKNCSLDT